MYYPLANFKELPAYADPRYIPVENLPKCKCFERNSNGIFEEKEMNFIPKDILPENAKRLLNEYI